MTAAPVDLTILIPAYNEAQRLPATLQAYEAFFKAAIPSYEMLVVDDGSTDETAAVVSTLAATSKSLRLLRLPKNCGKGAALKRGAAEARGRLVLFADADGSTPPEEYLRLAAACAAGADIAIGSRALGSKETALRARLHRKFLGRLFNTAVNLALLPGIADTQCGFKLFTAATAQALFPRLTIPGFGFDLELLYLARKQQLRIDEVSVSWHHTSGSKVNLVRDSLQMLGDLFRIRRRHGL